MLHGGAAYSRRMCTALTAASPAARGRSIFAWGFELGTGGRARPRRQQRRANTRRGARSDCVSRRVYMFMSMYMYMYMCMSMSMYVCMCRCIALYVCDVCDLAVQLCCVRVLRRRQRTVLLVASDRFLNLVIENSKHTFTFTFT